MVPILKRTRHPISDLPDEALIHRVWDVEEIKKVMARRTFYQANEAREAELSRLWVSLPENQATASIGSNWGYYVGMGEIRKYYIQQRQAALEQDLAAWQDASPELHLRQEDLGFGRAQMHPVSTHLIEEAEDGKTAQGLFYSVGYEAVGRPNGKSEALWYCECVAVDFIREPSGWKIWHLVITNDFVVAPGSVYSSQPLLFPPGEHPCQKEFGVPTVPMRVHDTQFHWADGYPFLPEPYTTYRPERGYGPQGHPDYDAKGGEGQ